MLYFKILTFLWPFIREMILGKKTWKEVLKTNKRGLVVFGLIIFLLFYGVMATRSLIHVSQRVVELEKATPTPSKPSFPLNPPPNVSSNDPPEDKAPKAQPADSGDNSALKKEEEELRDFFAKIKERERQSR